MEYITIILALLVGFGLGRYIKVDKNSSPASILKHKKPAKPAKILIFDKKVIKSPEAETIEQLDNERETNA